jgi:hypothetical protein
MQNFKLGSLADWHQLDLAKGFIFDAQQQRRVEFELIASDLVHVYLVDPAEGATDELLAAVGAGRMSITFTTAKPVALQIAAPDEAVVYIRTKDASHIVEATDDEAYTRLHIARPLTEAEKMMRFARLNQLQMEDRLAAEISKLRAQLSTSRPSEPVRADGGGTPPADPKPAPAGEPSGGGAQESGAT